MWWQHVSGESEDPGLSLEVSAPPSGCSPSSTLSCSRATVFRCGFPWGASGRGGRGLRLRIGSVGSSSETLARRTALWNEEAPWEIPKYIGRRGQAGDRNWTYWHAEDTCKWEALPAPNPNYHMEFLSFEENWTFMLLLWSPGISTLDIGDDLKIVSLMTHPPFKSLCQELSRLFPQSSRLGFTLFRSTSFCVWKHK